MSKAARKPKTKDVKESVRVSRRGEFTALDAKKHGVGGLIRGKIRWRKQDKRARSAEGYAVVFFPRIHGIGKACIYMFGLDYSLSRSPEAAISKFMDRIAGSETWVKMSKAGHRVRKVRVIDLGDA
jgi:hypothetical protein